MNYKVLIPCAGTGSRLGGLTKNLNKALVEVANKPGISHIIDKFPKDIGFVIALGYKGELVQEYLSLAYPERKFEYAWVDPFEGDGSGLGLSVLACKEFLQLPFIFCSCDTIVEEAIPEPKTNWAAYAKLKHNDEYRTLEIKNDLVVNLLEKGIKADNAYPYIGLSGIADYKKFWQEMEFSHSAIAIGESYGLKALSEIKAYEFTWHDTGNMQSLTATRKHFHNPDGPNILEKPTEAIWFVNNRVIKFNTDTKFIADRVKRVKVLGDFVPQIIGATEHMYSYMEVEGEVLSKIIDLNLFEKLLDYSLKFWNSSPAQPRKLNPEEQQRFNSTCMNFYKDKTFERVKQYYSVFENEDREEEINGVTRGKTLDMLNEIDWDWLADGLPGSFHGDFHFENILYSKADDKFTFLDWRQNFGGIIEYGDIYYDLAKLNHGIIVCHELIAKDLYSTEGIGGKVKYDLARKPILIECEKFFKEYLITKSYDYDKVYLLTALIYLNIAALHHYPYCHLLYYLGKDMLAKANKCPRALQNQ